MKKKRKVVPWLETLEDRRVLAAGFSLGLPAIQTIATVNGKITDIVRTFDSVVLSQGQQNEAD
ncbi:MAG: hypothetical protein EXR99_00420 [Gemmataceae bacterium]|nr:hypothetical protein [Gemmataceae bacterium]